MRSTAPPSKVLRKLRAIATRLPETIEEPAWVGQRWKIRKKTFAHVVEIEAGYPPAYAKAAEAEDATVLTVRSAGFLYDALRTAGPPYFTAPWGTQWGTHVIGIILDSKTSWDEVGLVMTESYRLLAPKKLAAAIAPVRSW